MKKKSFLQRVLFNNQIIFILSIVLALSIWVYMSMGSSNDTVVTVNDIPIQVSLSDDAAQSGLTAFFPDKQAYASVTVTGNRKLLGSISKDDFIVTANASNVDRAGVSELSVSADKKSSINNTFQITNCAPSKITVKVDTASQKDFKITTKFKFSAKNDDQYANVQYDTDKITVRGPSEEVRAIDKICAVTDDLIDLSSTKEFDANIVLYDKDNKELSKDYLELSLNSVHGTVNVSPQKTVEIKATYSNKPSEFNADERLSIAPKTVNIAGEQDVLDRVFSVKLDEIDFTTLENKKYEFNSLKPYIPEGCKIIDNNSILVTLDLSKLSSKSINVSKFKVKNLPKGFKSEITTKNLKVKLIGTEEQLKALTADKITAVMDASGLNGNTGSQELPVTFDLGDNKTCWVTGAHLATVVIENQ